MVPCRVQVVDSYRIDLPDPSVDAPKRQRASDGTYTKLLHKRRIAKAVVTVRERILIARGIVASFAARLVVYANDVEPFAAFRVDELLLVDFDGIDCVD